MLELLFFLSQHVVDALNAHIVIYRHSGLTLAIIDVECPFIKLYRLRQKVDTPVVVRLKNFINSRHRLLVVLGCSYRFRGLTNGLYTRRLGSGRTDFTLVVINGPLLSGGVLRGQMLILIWRVKLFAHLSAAARLQGLNCAHISNPN